MAEAVEAAGTRELYPPQALAVEAGLLSGDESFVVSAPTASGKTLIAEMAVLKVFFEGAGKAVYLVPLRALAAEKYAELTEKYGPTGMRVTLSTGDLDSADPWLQGADVIIATNEKMDSLIRHHTPWLAEVRLVVADEVHLMGDPHRGPTLEVVLTRLRAMARRMRFIALSATIPNADEMAGWLGARLVRSDWRPVPLREGVFHNGAVIFGDGAVKWISEESRSDAVDIALDTVREGGQALIFVSTRKATEAVARTASESLGKYVSVAERAGLEKLAAEVLRASPEPTRLCRKLSACVMEGSAFHHAGINHAQRKLVEDAFRANRLKILASTTTLAMGLNLPSRRVVIRDWMRYESGVGMRPLPAIEIKQMSGRAGRPKFDRTGEAVIVARNRRDERHLFEKYITGEVERIASRLSNEPALRSHILASIAGGFTRSRDELLDFLRGTFFALQSGMDYLTVITDEITDFLAREGMVSSERQNLLATRFGRRVSELYIDPLSAVVLRDALRRSGEKDAFPLLHMVARTPDMMRLSVRKKDIDETLEAFYAHADSLLVPDDEKYPSEDALSEIKTASVLMQWALETHEDKIVGHFGIGPGDLRTMVELADWLLYSSSEICRIFSLKEALKPLSVLRTRVAYGVKEELLELVSLRGIGRVRARNLFDAGYRSRRDILAAPAEALAEVPAVGKAVAADIKRQAEEALGGKR
ncbi:MAG: ATP-dependent DNA helicase [Thermodesulfovibrionales bacterium]